MKHELRRETLLLCDPKRYEERCKIVDAHEPPSRNPSHRTENGDSDPYDQDADEDIWGDPIPRAYVADGGIAVIPVKGVISQDLPSVFKAYGYVNLADVRADLIAAAKDNSVNAICLDVDSPGGTLRGVQETAALVAAIGESKDVWTFVGGDCCSAAYYVCAASKAIMATPSSELGSIGVYTYNVNDRGFWERMGVRIELFKSGKFKAAGFAGQDLTQDQRGAIQNRIDSIGATFRAHVSAYRQSVKAETMEGQSFLGSDAVGVGLADDNVADRSEMLLGLKGYYQNDQSI